MIHIGRRGSTRSRARSARSVPPFNGELWLGHAFLTPVTMYLFMAVVAQADQLSPALVCRRLCVPCAQCQLRPVLQVVDMVDCVGLPISVIFILTILTLKLIQCQNLSPFFLPLIPVVEQYRICGQTILDIFFFFFRHKTISKKIKPRKISAEIFFREIKCAPNCRADPERISWLENNMEILKQFLPNTIISHMRVTSVTTFHSVTFLVILICIESISDAGN